MIPVIFSTNPLASNEAARGAKRLARSARRRSSSCPTLGECETNGHGVKVICQDLHLDFVETKKRNKQWCGKKQTVYSLSCVLHCWTTTWGTGRFWSKPYYMRFTFSNSATEKSRMPPWTCARLGTSFQTEVFVGKAYSDGALGFSHLFIHNICCLNPPCSKLVMEYGEHATTSTRPSRFLVEGAGWSRSPALPPAVFLSKCISVKSSCKTGWVRPWGLFGEKERMCRKKERGKEVL